ncbi:MAG: phosphodiesterase [Pseudothermotoga sp.]|nr:phosphodiesterase [Pseudothermotoga sp.]MCX7812326.1 phosphodiesterase [Pseudothermotoga sp.]MDW8139396.1 phosphodiesterase [Pseudothermotoga sp.]
MNLRRILIVSDTHGSLTSWKKLKALVGSVDEIYHLGDVLYHGPRNPLPEGYDPSKLAEELKHENLFLVRGNCDADVDLLVLGISEAPKVLLLSFGGIDSVLTHGEFFVDEQHALRFLENYRAQILFYGHSHVPRFDQFGLKLVINPGSLSLPKLHTDPSFVLLEIGDSIKISLISLDGKITREVFL